MLVRRPDPAPVDTPGPGLPQLQALCARLSRAAAGRGAYASRWQPEQPTGPWQGTWGWRRYRRAGHGPGRRCRGQGRGKKGLADRWRRGIFAKLEYQVRITM